MSPNIFVTRSKTTRAITSHLSERPGLSRIIASLPTDGQTVDAPSAVWPGAPSVWIRRVRSPIMPAHTAGTDRRLAKEGLGATRGGPAGGRAAILGARHVAPRTVLRRIRRGAWRPAGPG